MVWAIGSPFGLQKSITFGIISAKERHGINSPREFHLPGILADRRSRKSR